MSAVINTVVVMNHNIGGHFFCWSLDFIAGHSDVTIENFNGKNWHHNNTNISYGHDDAVAMLNKLKLSDNTQESLYIAKCRPNTASRMLFDDEYDNITHKQRQTVADFRRDDFKRLIDYLQKSKYLPIILDYYEHDLLSSFYNSRHIGDYNGVKYSNIESYIDHYASKFYPDSQLNFENNIWDRRERLALILQNDYAITNSHNLVDTSKPHLYYTTDDVWNKLDSIMPEIFKLSKLPWNWDKFEQWKEIYMIWRELHDYSFSRNFNRIIDAIVNNRYLSLERFNIDFVKEVLILQALIKNHNLNLKNWQLYKFPDNTQDLHRLLEPNIHIS